MQHGNPGQIIPTCNPTLASCFHWGRIMGWFGNIHVFMHLPKHLSYEMNFSKSNNSYQLVRSWVKDLTYSATGPHNLKDRYYFHFTNEETEMQKSSDDLSKTRQLINDRGEIWTCSGFLNKSPLQGFTGLFLCPLTSVWIRSHFSFWKDSQPYWVFVLFLYFSPQMDFLEARKSWCCWYFF